MKFTKIVEKIVAILKKDPAYKFKSDFDSRQLATIVFYRSLQLLRGLPLKLWLHANGFTFCGRSVVIEHGYMIKAGQNLILEDFVHINALSTDGIVFGRNVSLGRGAVIICTGVVASKGVGLTVGDHTGINANAYIGCQGGVQIGSNVIMGPGIKIFSENHNFSSADIPIRLQGETRNPVTIEDDCWIGAGATILAGVTIGRGSVVAAGAVVNNSFPAKSLIVGVPAKAIRNRVS